jgi:hypothetical protein
MVQNSPNERNDAKAPVPPDATIVAPTARRRLLRTGLVGGPVALLTAGKPVKTLASTYCSFSGWNSLTLSKSGKSKSKSKKALSHTPPTGGCSTAGNGPTHYFEKSGSSYKEVNWPSAYKSESSTLTFGTLFPRGPSLGYSGDKVLSILGGQPTSIGAMIIAALFDAADGTLGTLTVSDVQTLWYEYAADGSMDGSETYAMALQNFLTQLINVS